MRAVFRFLLCVTGSALVTAGVIMWLLFSGKLDLTHMLYQLRYNPLVTARQPVEENRLVSTNVLKLNLRSFSLPSMETESPFISGGGAILPLGGGRILVLNKYGQLYRFSQTDNGPVLETLNDGVKTNNDIYLEYAASQGYTARPGTNVGFAGLGSRGIDLLHLKKLGMIALSYTQWQPDKHCMVNKVSVRPIDQQMNFLAGSGWKEIFVSKPCIEMNPHNKNKPLAGHQTGGRMYELPDGRFLLSTGDIKQNGVNRVNLIDDPNADLGKIFIVDPLTGTREIFSTGQRNPQGLVIAGDGTIWETEHGPSGGDELNILVRGKNYGWPHVTMGRLCLGCEGVLNGRHDGYEPPVFAWTPGIGVSNLVEIKNVSDAWDGNLLIASLKNQSLHRVVLRDRQVIMDEVINIGERLRDIYQTDTGDFVIWTDSGKIIFLSPLKQKTKVERMIAGLSAQARRAIRGCSECHDFEPGLGQPDKISLWRVIGRNVASTNYAFYSNAFRAKGGRWDETSLDAFIADPLGFIPGNAMGDNGVADKGLRKEILRFINKLH